MEFTASHLVLIREPVAVRIDSEGTHTFFEPVHTFGILKCRSEHNPSAREVLAGTMVTD